MAYTLEQFCHDSRHILAGDGDIQSRIDGVAAKLADLLRNDEFVRETFPNDDLPAKRELYHDPDHDFYVLAHIQKGGKKGMPHSHGASWAIYGNATGFTRMREYKRTNPESEEAAVLEKVAEYDVKAGDTKAYGPGYIHSTEHPETCYVIRLTGTDLDQIPRYRFRKMRDKVLEEA